jgi:hypothetical protein
MTADSLAGYIVENNNEKAEKLSTEIDRLLLRIANYPALCSALKRVGGKAPKTELVFSILPDEFIDRVCQLIGPVEIEKFKFVGDQQEPCSGFRFDLTPLIPDKDSILDPPTYSA